MKYITLYTLSIRYISLIYLYVPPFQLIKKGTLDTYMQNEYISLLKKYSNINITICNLLVTIYSINISKSISICNKLGFNPNKKLKTIADIDFILKTLSNFLKLIEKSEKIKSKKLQNIETITYLNCLKNTKNLKYYRLKNGLPVHGQRTHSNGQIAKLKLHFND